MHGIFGVDRVSCFSYSVKGTYRRGRFQRRSPRPTTPTTTLGGEHE